MGLFSEIAFGPCPSFALSPGVGAVNLAAGHYTYLVAFNTPSGIAGLSPQVPVTSSGTGGVGITIAPAFVPATATGYQVYRTTNGGGAFFAITGSPFALTVAGTQFVDTTNDVTLGGNTALPASVISSGLISTQRLKELTNPDNPQNAAAGPNLAVLQSVVWEAQAFFYAETGVPYDDTTPAGPPPAIPTNQPQPVFPPAGGNVCHYTGVGIVIAMLYDYRAQAFPQAEVDAAWREARRRLERWRTQWGSVRWIAPGTDSNYTPTKPVSTIPDMDASRLSRSLVADPRPTAQGGPGVGGSARSGGGFMWGIGGG